MTDLDQAWKEWEMEQKKPREFWIRELTLICNDRKGLEFGQDVVHVREVVPIDWENVWKLFEEHNGFNKPYFESIIEKAIKGEV